MAGSKLSLVTPIPIKATYRIQDEYQGYPCFDVTIDDLTLRLYLWSFPKNQSIMQDLAVEVRRAFRLDLTRDLVLSCAKDSPPAIGDTSKLKEFFNQEPEPSAFQIGWKLMKRDIRYVVNIFAAVPFAAFDALLTAIIIPVYVFNQNLENVLRKNDGTVWFWRIK